MIESAQLLPILERSRNKRVQDKIDEVYQDQATWNRMSILNTAGSGFFSSDRTIHDYVDRIWHTAPCRVPCDGNTAGNGVGAAANGAAAA